MIMYYDIHTHTERERHRILKDKGPEKHERTAHNLTSSTNDSLWVPDT